MVIIMRIIIIETTIKNQKRKLNKVELHDIRCPQFWFWFSIATKFNTCPSIHPFPQPLSIRSWIENWFPIIHQLCRPFNLCLPIIHFLRGDPAPETTTELMNVLNFFPLCSGWCMPAAVRYSYSKWISNFALLLCATVLLCGSTRSGRPLWTSGLIGISFRHRVPTFSAREASQCCV